MSKKRNHDGNLIMTILHIKTCRLSGTVREIYSLECLHWKRRKAYKYVSCPNIAIKPFLKKG